MNTGEDRTQAEIHADNALDSAKLKRVQANGRRLLGQLRDLPRGARVDAAAVAKALEDALKGKAGPA